MSASCSIEPDSRRSDSIGFLSSRCSTARLSCDSAITGRSSSLASCFSPRLISEISWTRLSFDSLARPRQQLQVIDDDHADALLPLEPPRAGAQRGDGQPRRIVDVERQRRQLARGARQVAELLLADLAHAQIFGRMPDCSARMRVANWSADISRLKNATGAPPTWPARCRPPGRARSVARRRRRCWWRARSCPCPDARRGSTGRSCAARRSWR